LNNEPFVRETIIPFGENPPYKTDTGFRIPAPVGELELKFYYSGCSGYEIIEDQEENPKKVLHELEFIHHIEVKNNMVLKLSFSGNDLVNNVIKPNEKITLKEINQKLIKIEKALSGEIVD